MSAAPVMVLSVPVWDAAVQLPDADTDVLVWAGDEPEAQLGAYVGHAADGSALWVGAHGQAISVRHWAGMPGWNARVSGPQQAARK